MTIRIGAVEVSLGRLSSDQRKFSLNVYVRSVVRPGLQAQNEIDPGKFSNAAAVLQAVGVAAGAGAEYLGVKYGDNIDPSTAVRDAMRATAEEMKLMASLSGSVPEKLRHLNSKKSLLSNRDLESLKWFNHLYESHNGITPAEVLRMNEIIAKIHAAGQ